MRTWSRALSLAVLLATPTVLAFFSGGYFEGPRLVAGIVAWLLVAVAVAVTARPLLPRTTAARVSLAGLALLTLWTGLGTLWAPLGTPAQDDFQRLLLYVGFVLAGAMLLRDLPRRALEPALALGAFVVVGYSLSERLLPALLSFSESRSAAGRLEQPLTYWNAVGCLAALGVVLCIRVAADPRQSRITRGLAGGATVPLGVGVFLSYSRGALAALVLGLAVLLLLVPHMRPLIKAAAIVVAGCLLASLVAAALPQVNAPPIAASGSPPAGATGQGLLMLVTLVVVGAAAAVGVARVSVGGARGPARLRSRRMRALALGGVVLAMVVAVGSLAALEGSPDADAPQAGAGARRLTTLSTDRYAYWRVALRAAADHPVQGTGPGGFAVEWLAKRDRRQTPSDAHSLYIETLAELGLLGGLFLAMFLLGAGAAALALARDDPQAAAGPSAGLASWAVAAGIDWHWEMPGVTLVALCLAAALIAWAGHSARLARDTDDAVPGGQLA